jgi:hypothetical protein
MPVNVAVQTQSHPVTVFRYVGNTYMLFYGPSGKKYRFSGYGAEREVDPRDREFVRNIPNLREVRR